MKGNLVLVNCSDLIYALIEYPLEIALQNKTVDIDENGD